MQMPANVQDAIDRIPPEAWPVIDIAFKVTVGIVIVWIVLSLFGWWRRRAYNLTVASTARRNRKAEPDFLHVDKKAREAAIERGEAHEEMLEEREAREAAIAAGKDPVGMGRRIAQISALLMSIFTLLCGVMGAVANVGAMEASVKNLTAAGKIQYIVTQHPIGTAIAVLVIVYNIYHYISHRRWQEA